MSDNSGRGVKVLEVSVENETQLTDFCFCLAGPPTASFHTQARRDTNKKKKAQKHKSTVSYRQVRIRRGLGEELPID